ncbi:MAG: PAS domain S-box protein [Pseudomonadota bacterium]|nr:PAS domain S-box protein [Pseudomonadota bacterium]
MATRKSRKERRTPVGKAGKTSQGEWERYRILVEEATEGIMLVAADESETWVNAAFARMHGYESPEEMQHLRLKDIDAPETAVLAPERWRRVLAGEELDFEAEHLRKDGSVFSLHVSAKLIEIEGKRYVMGRCMDITARKRAEEAVRSAHESLLAIFNGIDEPIYVADMDNHDLLFLNRVIEDMFGPLDGRKCYEYIQQRTAPCPFCTNDIIRGEYRGRSYIWEFQNEQNRRWYRCIDKMIPWPDGRSARYEMAIDVTERKEAEKERERFLEQLAHSQKIESVGRLAGGIAHDFNNMLLVILGHAELALRRLRPDDPARADLLMVRSAAERSAALTRQLLAFARKQTIAPAALDLNETVATTLCMLRRLIGEDIELKWTPGQHRGTVLMDPMQMDQILMNLCTNARDAVGKGGMIAIETDIVEFDDAYCATHIGYVPGEYVLLAVSDNGRGMDSATRERLFEPFFSTKESGKGTGMGLPTVYGIVRQNNGFINVYSEPGQGAIFRIYLPRCAEKAAAESRVTAEPEGTDKMAEPEGADKMGEPEGTDKMAGPEGEDKMAEPEGATVRGDKTILIVEDEAMIRDFAQEALEMLGYTVIVAATPDEALRAVDEYHGPIDLLLTDIVLPGMNGRELSDILLARHPTMERLFMSGYAENVITHQGILAPGLHFLQKPFRIQDLAGKVQEVLAGK